MTEGFYVGVDMAGNYSGTVVMVINGKVVGYLTAPEFAKKCGVADITVRKWIEHGRLTPGQYIKIGRETWIKEDVTMPKRKPGRPKKVKFENATPTRS